jgi:DNA replication protein DnaC
MTTAPALVDALRLIGLRHTAETLDDIVALATKRRWGPTQLLEHVAELEQAERAQRSLERRVDRSHLGRFRSMADFDWAWPSHIDRELVDAVLQLSFLPDARNVVLVAPQGLGKTMIAQNIVHAALLAGHSALFVTASQLLLDLGAQESTRALDRRLRFYASRALLCIDEIGYLSYDTRNADLLFQVVSRRYERRSLVMTTNLAFAEWATVFPNAACTTALIDRVVHHADIIAIEGESYRKREAQAAITKGNSARKVKG